jgi:hypothetical protein
LAVAAGVGLVIYSTSSGGAAAQAITDVGKFRAGSELGEERAGFSGRAKLLVFTNPSAADWLSVSACLQNAAVEAELDFFAPILIDERVEQVEPVTRERDGMSVVVRGLNGAFLGGLHAGYTCSDLVEFMRSVKARATMAPDPSPIYAALRENALIVDSMIQTGDRARAEKFVGFLREFDGATSPAVVAAEARLGQ